MGHALIKLTPEQLVQRHRELHNALDELLACWLEHGSGLTPDDEGRIATQRPIKDLLEYSARAKEPPVVCGRDKRG